jgi:hypothetical protein
VCTGLGFVRSAPPSPGHNRTQSVAKVNRAPSKVSTALRHGPAQLHGKVSKRIGMKARNRMKPLDLSVEPPRAPRAELDGCIFLPRSIDKVRATLPGGKLGDYRIEGLTQMMLETLGVSLDTFTLVVAAADDESEIATFLREHAASAEYAGWNAFVSAREPRGGNRAEALTVYPWLKDRPELLLVLDVLAEDDNQSFAPAR